MDFSSDDFSKNFAVFDRPYKCTCYCFNRPQMTGKISQNDLPLGRIYMPCTCCDPRFNLYNNKEQLRYKITADCCQCGFFCKAGCGRCGEVLFTIHNSNKTDCTIENKDGSIKKCNAGLQELISDADNFEIVFPIDASPEEKFMLIGATLMLDYAFFEDNGSNNSNQLI